ncbi:unnamed protein product [Calicophoron daubneyi]|uniref:Integrin alpha third immunoglobulin-like domain-containing protein n=1 Tax=Calicophoron daubneyi TaxID=300641 RepID=A0AAV2T8U0_CALDB
MWNINIIPPHFLGFYLTLLIGVCPQSPWFPPFSTGDVPPQETVFYPVAGTLTKRFSTQLSRIVDEALNSRSVSELFQWSSVTVFRDFSASGTSAWVVMGGAAPRSRSSSPNPFTKEAVGVVGCTLVPDQLASAGFRLGSCEALRVAHVSVNRSSDSSDMNRGAGLLGVGLSSLELDPPSDGSVLVYCDPLWRAESIHPGGRCQIRLRRNGRWIESSDGKNTEDSIQFCSTAEYSRPCGGGFSVDLRQSSAHTNSKTAGEDVFYSRSSAASSLPAIKLVAGLPYAQPTGEVQFVDNILRNFDGRAQFRSTPSNTYRVIGGEQNFGMKVTWTMDADRGSRAVQGDRESLALVGSPSAVPLPKMTALHHLGNSPGQRAFDVVPPEGETSSGFGHSVEAVRIVTSSSTNASGRADYAIIIGAPFASGSTKGPNFGRVYIYCPDQTTEETRYARSSLRGTQAQGFFGYSIVRVGDLDGDGVEDIAISAPGLHPFSNKPDGGNAGVAGQVYVHRVMPDCSLDPKPLQILQAPDGEAGDGFGVGLSRGLDIDSDGCPELVVTSLRPNTAPYIFTMPKRLRAQCQVSVPPAFSLTPFQTGTTVPVSISVRLFDLQTLEWMKIPEGLASGVARIHQINPDVLWQAKNSGNKSDILNGNATLVDDVDSFFISTTYGEMDPSKPRFRLVEQTPIHVDLSAGGDQMTVKFKLQAVYGAQSMDLVSVPLRVAYRSLLKPSTCLGFDTNERLCIKSQQPLIDWSLCESPIRLAQHICVPEPECKADLALETLVINETDHPAEKTGVLEFGSSKSRHQVAQFRLTNNGPTKTAGIRVQIRANGRVKGEPPVGVKLHVTEVTANRANPHDRSSSAGNPRSKKDWVVNIAEDGSAAVISSRSHQWLYANESVDLRVSTFVEGLSATHPDSRPNELSEDQLKKLSALENIAPGLHVRAISASTDVVDGNDELTMPYKVLYKPRIEISAGAQPLTIIDGRKEAPEIYKDMRKVFSEEIGPKVEHKFLIENRGEPPLSNITLALDLPIATADGYTLLYLTDQVRQRVRNIGDGASAIGWKDTLPKIVSADGKQVGRCEIAREFLNPLDFTLLDFGQDSQTGVTERRRVQRTRRDVGSQPKISRMGSAGIEGDEGDGSGGLIAGKMFAAGTAFRRANYGRLDLVCPAQDKLGAKNQPLSRWPKCVRVRCRLEKLDKGDAVRLQWTGWLWAATFFKLHTPDVRLVSRLSVENWGDLPTTILTYQKLGALNPKAANIVKFDYPTEAPSFELKQSIIFRNVELAVIRQIPLWPIIVGAVVGVLFLIFMGAGFYCCGFFTRQKHKLIAKEDKALRSSSKDRLLDDTEQEERQRQDIPVFLSAVPHSRVRSSKKISNGHRVHAKPGGKLDDQSEYLVQESPNLLCAEGPEPPSPKMGPKLSSHQSWEQLPDHDWKTRQEKYDPEVSPKTAEIVEPSDKREMSEDGAPFTVYPLEEGDQAINAQDETSISKDQFGEIDIPEATGSTASVKSRQDLLPPESTALDDNNKDLKSSEVPQHDDLPSWMVKEVDEENKKL